MAMAMVKGPGSVLLHSYYLFRAHRLILHVTLLFWYFWVHTMEESLYQNANGLNDDEAAKVKYKSQVTIYPTASRVTVPQIQRPEDFPHLPKRQVQSDDHESTLVCYVLGESSIDLPLLTPHRQLVCPEQERGMCHW